ncbi:hypothetical protein [Pontibacter harenae]|uniref:hypothetical protein n=1 Tax=Pontibacter harenae TaxID=2894083 RepID=UPI001E5B0454|nr:hypothetical protein [Pontibacter harenae]MCC9167996.1 hypothetical protein [Pontibacter harenae]
MKKLMLLASLCLLLNSSATLAQISTSSTRVQRNQGKTLTHTTKLENAKGNQVVVTMSNSDVQVIGHNSNEVVIEAKNYQGAPARAAGLKPLYNQLEDNTGLGLHVIKENNGVKISKTTRQDGKYIIKVPKNVAVVFHETNWTDGNLNMSDLDGEIELKLQNWNASLTNITGPVVANATNSDIVIKFSSLNQSKPSAVSVITGTVEIYLPAGTKADFKMKSVQGQIYSDLDMNIPKEPKSNLPRMTGGTNIQGKTNGGGVEMTLYTISGDMFIRKSK